MSQKPLVLPLAPQKYDQGLESQRNRAIQSADEQNQKRYGDYEIAEGDLILRDPDGIAWKVKIDRSGKLFSQSVGAGILDEFLESVTISASGTVT